MRVQLLFSSGRIQARWHRSIPMAMNEDSTQCEESIIISRQRECCIKMERNHSNESRNLIRNEKTWKSGWLNMEHQFQLTRSITHSLCLFKLSSTAHLRHPLTMHIRPGSELIRWILLDEWYRRFAFRSIPVTTWGSRRHFDWMLSLGHSSADHSSIQRKLFSDNYSSLKQLNLQSLDSTRSARLPHPRRNKNSHFSAFHC